MSGDKKIRIFYFVCFLLLLAAEFYIGLFVRDRFIRPYFGDVLVVIVLYALLRTIFLKKPVALSLWIFLFALLVEVTQLLPLVDVLGIKNRFIRVLMGNSFAWGDVIAYAAGTIVNIFFDLWGWKRKGKGSCG